MNYNFDSTVLSGLCTASLRLELQKSTLSDDERCAVLRELTVRGCEVVSNTAQSTPRILTDSSLRAIYMENARRSYYIPNRAYYVAAARAVNRRIVRLAIADRIDWEQRDRRLSERRRLAVTGAPTVDAYNEG